MNEVDLFEVDLFKVHSAHLCPEKTFLGYMDFFFKIFSTLVW